MIPLLRRWSWNGCRWAMVLCKETQHSCHWNLPEQSSGGVVAFSWKDWFQILSTLGGYGSLERTNFLTMCINVWYICRPQYHCSRPYKCNVAYMFIQGCITVWQIVVCKVYAWWLYLEGLHICHIYWYSSTRYVCWLIWLWDICGLLIWLWCISLPFYAHICKWYIF